MQPEQVNKHLANYKFAKGRAAHLETRIRALKKELIELSEDAYCTIGARAFTGLPKGSETADPTAATAVRIADGEIRTDAHEQSAWLADMQAEHAQWQLTIAYVEGWLCGLMERERWVIERHAIEGVSWNNVVGEFNASFGSWYTKRQLMRVKQAGLEKMYMMAR